jgi:hypothetical protein
MKTYGRTTVHEFLGDFVVYRGLVPLDERLPSLEEVREEANVPEGVIPRKGDPAYGRVIAHLLQRGQELNAPGVSTEQLMYIGDTRMSDGNAFAAICHAGRWPGIAFIASETQKPGRSEIIEQRNATLYLANRWSAIAEFEGFCREQGLSIDERTAIVVDLDKTALGARGRNDHVINQARVEAVRRTVEDLLGAEFSQASSQIAYDRLNRTEFHPFTADNQDYLAYICLILGAGLYRLDPLLERVRANRMRSFGQFIAEVDEHGRDLPASLREIHERIYGRVQEGDPTPFKAFRRSEYITTVDRMGCLGDDASVEELLAGEILITHEVREAALHWKARGALLFGLSDKPDEASMPGEELALQGCHSIHRVETHAVGSR